MSSIDEIHKAIEYMATCIGESKDERRDDTSMIFKEMEDKILAVVETAIRESAVEALEVHRTFHLDASRSEDYKQGFKDALDQYDKAINLQIERLQALADHSRSPRDEQV